MGHHRKHVHGKTNQIAPLVTRLSPEELEKREQKIQARATVAETLTRQVQLTQQFAIFAMNKATKRDRYIVAFIIILTLLQLGFDLHHVLKVF